MWLSDLECLDISRFNEEKRQPSSGSAWPAWQKNEGFDTICTTVCIDCDSSIACRLCRLELNICLYQIYINLKCLLTAMYSCLLLSYSVYIVFSNVFLFHYPIYRLCWFQRSQPTRGGTVWQQQMPANRDQHLS